MKQNKREIVKAYSFMGLMASEGKLPGRTSSPTDEIFLSDRVDTLWNFVSNTASDVSDDSDFFDLMIDANQMHKDRPLAA